MRRALVIFLLTGLAGCGPGTTGSAPDPIIPPIESLTTEWGCGNGFWISNPQQTAALHLSYRGEGRPDRQVELPHPAWEAAVVLGENIHANWCDDVLEPGEPVAEEQARLPVVAGQLALVGDIPDGTGGGGGHSATLEASDLEVALPNGARQPLGSITITNSNWGLVAG